MAVSAKNGENGARKGRSESGRPCAANARRKRRLIDAMAIQVKSALTPVRLMNLRFGFQVSICCTQSRPKETDHVKTTPSPQTVVRKVRNENASVSLGV
jgi:hypothetical protein